MSAAPAASSPLSSAHQASGDSGARCTAAASASRRARASQRPPLEAAASMYAASSDSQVRAGPHDTGVCACARQGLRALTLPRSGVRTKSRLTEQECTTRQAFQQVNVYVWSDGGSPARLRVQAPPSPAACGPALVWPLQLASPHRAACQRCCTAACWAPAAPAQLSRRAWVAASQQWLGWPPHCSLFGRWCGLRPLQGARTGKR